MLIAGTRANRMLASVVNRRVGADASMVAAKAWLIRCGAVGAMAMMIGAGIGLGFLGYARSREANGAAERLADTLTKALERAKLHAELDPDSKVKLDPAAQVALDPAAKVRLAEPELPRPTSDQLKSGAASPSKAEVKTNYTVFKTVRWGGGQVVTGYNFAPDGKLPQSQYCYFADSIDKLAYTTVHVAADGRFMPPPDPPKGFDAAKAAAECVWFDGRPTRF